LVIALCALAQSAVAQPHVNPTGAYSGAYTCTQGLTGMTLHLRAPAQAKGRAEGTIVFYEHPDNKGVPTGCYRARGTFDRATGRLVLDPDAWILRPSDAWDMTTIEGDLNAASGALEGRLFKRNEVTGCTTFALRKNAPPLKTTPSICQGQPATS
jgi:hypothetical protein